jgi:hypothetical protein
MVLSNDNVTEPSFPFLAVSSNSSGRYVRLLFFVGRGGEGDLAIECNLGGIFSTPT